MYVMLVLRPVATEKERDLPMMLFSFTIHPSTSTIQSSKPPTPTLAAAHSLTQKERPRLSRGWEKKKHSRFIHPESTKSKWERMKETGVQKEGTKEEEMPLLRGGREKNRIGTFSHIHNTFHCVCKLYTHILSN